MERVKLKEIISGLLREGESLGNVQKILVSEYSEKITFLDLKLLVSEIENIDWTKNEEPDAKPADKNVAIEEDTTGKTVVEINKLARPGVAMHGSVKFASGASADWILDQMGRLGFEKSDGEPTSEDIQEFQTELQKLLGA